MLMQQNLKTNCILLSKWPFWSWCSASCQNLECFSSAPLLHTPFCLQADIPKLF